MVLCNRHDQFRLKLLPRTCNDIPVRLVISLLVTFKRQVSMLWCVRCVRCGYPKTADLKYIQPQWQMTRCILFWIYNSYPFPCPTSLSAARGLVCCVSQCDVKYVHIAPALHQKPAIQREAIPTGLGRFSGQNASLTALGAVSKTLPGSFTIDVPVVRWPWIALVRPSEWHHNGVLTKRAMLYSSPIAGLTFQIPIL